jgi:hypothetical protein
MKTSSVVRALPSILRTVLLVANLLLLCSCSSSQDEELEKATLEAEKAKTELARLQAELAVATAANPPSVASEKPAGLRAWRDTEADEFCEWIGVDANCYRFEGGWLDVYIDLEVAGESQVFDSAAPLHHVSATNPTINGPVVGDPSGRFIWIRSTKNGEEGWTLGYQMSVEKESGESSGSSGPRAAPSGGLLTPASNVKQTVEMGDAEVFLKEGETVTLITLKNFGENGEVTRTAKLKCRVITDEYTEPVSEF